MAKLILEQVANALRNNRSRVWSASLIGHAAMRDGAVVVALDEGDRQDVFRGAAAARVESGMTKEQLAASGRVVACVLPAADHASHAAGNDPASGWDAPIMVTPRAMLAALDEAQARLRAAEERIAEQRRQLEAARLAEIERDEEIRAIGAALDACGMPRVDAEGRSMDTATRARVAASCASRGWKITDVRIAQPSGERARIVPLEALRTASGVIVVDDIAPMREISAVVRARAVDWLRETGMAATQLPAQRGDLLEIAVDQGAPEGDRTAVSLAAVSASGLVTVVPVPPSGRFDLETMQCRAHGVVGCTRCIAEDINAAMDARKQREGQAR